jgi:DsbC/DsbD-like thiol-disulfide interchange protein
MSAWKNAMIVAALVPTFTHADGHAKVDVLSSSRTYEPGKFISSAIRMSYDDGWHGYWINPGETGMKTEVSWKLPAGWIATPLQFPVPERSTGSEIHSYNYHGTILIPFTLQVPADAKGDAVIEGEINWLACNENQCVSGNASIRLKLQLGSMLPTTEAVTIEKAIAALPQPSANHRLIRSFENGKITLRIDGPDLEKFAGASLFPVTEQALDPAYDWKFAIQDGACVVTGPANEYAEEQEQTSLELVVAGGKLSQPILLKWTKMK